MPEAAVGIDYRPALANREGIGRYVRELVRAYAELGADAGLALFGATWSAARFDADELGIAGTRARLVRPRIPSRVLPRILRWTRRGADDWLGGARVFHHTQPSLLPVRAAAEVATLFDCLYMTGEGFVDDASAARMERAAREQVRRARILFVPSAFVARDVVRRLGAAPGSVVVTELGCDHALRARSASAGERAPRGASPQPPYVLTVCRVDARKNLVRSLRAFEQVAARAPDIGWIVAGPRGHRASEFEAALESSPARERVRWLEYVPEAELASLYSGARAFLFASLGEGFGLPPLEAMLHGVPVVAGDATSLPEVCGDAAVLVDPRDADAIAHGLSRVLDDAGFARELAGRGSARAAAFTWRRCAERTLAGYARALAEPAPAPG